MLKIKRTYDVIGEPAGDEPSAEALEFAARHYPNKQSQHCIALAQTLDAFAARKVAEAVAAERERCAKIAEQHVPFMPGFVAAAIRAADASHDRRPANPGPERGGA